MKVTNARAFFKNALNRSLLASALLVAPLVSTTVMNEIAPDQTWLSVGQAQAQLIKPSTEQQEPRRVPGVSQDLIKKLTEVTAVIEPDPEEQPGVEPDLQRGLRMLQEIAEDMDEYNAYEQAQVHQYLANVYYQLDRPEKTLENFEAIVSKSPQIPTGLETNSWLFLSKLHMQEENYQKAINAFEQWAKMVNSINADDYYFASLLFYNMGNEDRALTHVNEAVRIAEEAGKTPDENWYSMQRLLYYNKEDFANMAKVLEKMVRDYPKVSYWRQLSDTYSMLERYDDRLYSLEVVYLLGGLDSERILISLASQYLDKEVPYKAAKILNKGIYEDEYIEPTADNLEMLANAWSMAQEAEKALVEMEKAAAKSDEGDLYARLAAIYTINERYQDAVDAGEEALEKGVSRSDQVYLRIGTAYANLEEYDQAIEALKQAAKDKRSRETAQGWITYVEKEKARVERAEAEREAEEKKEREAQERAERERARAEAY